MAFNLNKVFKAFDRSTLGLLGGAYKGIEQSYKLVTGQGTGGEIANRITAENDARIQNQFEMQRQFLLNSFNNSEFGPFLRKSPLLNAFGDFDNSLGLFSDQIRHLQGFRSPMIGGFNSYSDSNILY